MFSKIKAANEGSSQKRVRVGKYVGARSPSLFTRLSQGNQNRNHVSGGVTHSMPMVGTGGELSASTSIASAAGVAAGDGAPFCSVSSVAVAATSTARAFAPSVTAAAAAAATAGVGGGATAAGGTAAETVGAVAAGVGGTA